MDSNDTDSPPIPSSFPSRKRKRESLEERRVKCKIRKRRKRADLPPLVRHGNQNSPSTSGDDFVTETQGNPAGRIYMFDEAAHNRLHERVVAAGRPIGRPFREITSLVPDVAGSSELESEGGGEAEEQAVHSMWWGNRGDSSSIPDGADDFDLDSTAGEGECDSAGAGQQDERQMEEGGESETARNEGGNRDTFNNRNTEQEGNLQAEEDEARIPGGNLAQEEALLRRKIENVSEMEKLAIAMAGVRGSSNASNAALDKTLSVVFKHMETVRKLRRNRSTKKTFSKYLRRIAGKFIPKVLTDLLLEERTTEGGVEYKRVEGLAAIPDEYRSLSNTSKMRIIREESSVSLEDIKKHHERVHLQKGMTLEEIRKQYGNCMLSLDGVEESKSGLKKFHVASIKIGECIYPYKVYDLLIAHEAAKIKTETIMG